MNIVLTIPEKFNTSINSYLEDYMHIHAKVLTNPETFGNKGFLSLLICDIESDVADEIEHRFATNSLIKVNKCLTDTTN